MNSDDAALDALAAALAPRILREVRALLEAEGADDRALGVAALAEMGYVPGPCPGGQGPRDDQTRRQRRRTSSRAELAPPDDHSEGIRALRAMGYEVDAATLATFKRMPESDGMRVLRELGFDMVPPPPGLIPGRDCPDPDQIWNEAAATVSARHQKRKRSGTETR